MSYPAWKHKCKIRDGSAGFFVYSPTEEYWLNEKGEWIYRDDERPRDDFFCWDSASAALDRCKNEPPPSKFKHHKPSANEQRTAMFDELVEALQSSYMYVPDTSSVTWRKTVEDLIVRARKIQEDAKS